MTRLQATFGARVFAQAAPGVEEYLGRLWVLVPAAVLALQLRADTP